MDQMLQRPALVYPNIHIWDVNWLKANLLCFPKIYRMHPQDFKPRDYDKVGEFQQCSIDGGALLNSEFINNSENDSPAFRSQEMFMRQLEKNMDFAKKKFSRESTLLIGSYYCRDAGNRGPQLDNVRRLQPNNL